MLFNSYRFLFLFLPITMLGYQWFGRYGRRSVLLWLAATSLLFYAAWNPAFVVLLFFSVLINYLIAFAIHAAPPNSRIRNYWLIGGVTSNLFVLFYFKYLFKMLVLLHTFGVPDSHPHSILLPLGISFFTFTQISYLVDLAQGQAERQDFLSYLLFVTFFPHLIAGPILHHKEMMPQFGAGSAGVPRNFRLHSAEVSLGLTWFLLGLAKKVLLADSLAHTADLTFHDAGSLSFLSAFTGLVVYSMQLYFDFSGYSDMAIGLARIFSIRFPLNFDSPYKATSVTEYWQRWHITLTRYITLYLYNPILLGIQRRRLGRGDKISRKALTTPGGFTAMVAGPTLATMLLTGVWHGAGLQFLVFGLLHGFYLTTNQAWRHFRPGGTNPTAPRWPKRLAMMLGVYVQVSFALIFFRSNSMHAALALLRDLTGAHGFGSLGSVGESSLAFLLFPVVWFLPNTQQILGQERTVKDPIPGPAASTVLAHQQAPTLFRGLRWAPTLRWSLMMAVLLFAVLVELDPTAQFLYFQF